MVTVAELVFWIVCDIIAMVGILWVAAASQRSECVSAETIRRIENGGRYM